MRPFHKFDCSETHRCPLAEVLQQTKGYACLFSITEQLNRGCGLYVALLCDRLGPSSYTWVDFFYCFLIHTQSSDIETKQTTTPWCVCALSKVWLRQHTDWIEHWVYCTAGARHTTNHSSLHQPHSCHGEDNTDGFRARLWPHSAHIRAMCFTLYISYTIAFPSPNYRTNIMMGSRPWGITEGT